MPKPFISARIPEAVNSAIDKRAEQTGESRTDILLSALSNYLEGDIKAPISVDERLSALEEEFAQFKKELASPIQTTLLDNDTDNTNDNKRSSKKIVSENEPDNVIDNKDASQIDNSSDNDLENGRRRWTTKQIEAAGINRKTVEYRLKNRKLPYEKNGITIHSRLGKENREGRITSIWEVSEES